MQRIDTWAALTRAIDQPANHQLTPLLLARQDQLAGFAELKDLALFIVVEEGDSVEQVEEQLGFPITTNLVDGCRLGDPDFVPSWEYAERHPNGWTEIGFMLSDDGVAHVMLVPDANDLDPTLRKLCSLADNVIDQAEQEATP